MAGADLAADFADDLGAGLLKTVLCADLGSDITCLCALAGGLPSARIDAANAKLRNPKTRTIRIMIEPLRRGRLPFRLRLQAEIGTPARGLISMPCRNG
jgi:hypothetical protein